jgi:SpoIID/LytB domain protein
VIATRRFRRWTLLLCCGSVVAGINTGPLLLSAGAGTTRGPNAAQQTPTTAAAPVATFEPTPAGIPTSGVVPLSGATTPINVAPGRVVIDGKGYGHGVGLAQDGALWMGKNGKSSTQILALFFPGTTLSKRGGVVRVPLKSIDALTIVFPSGGTVGSISVPAGGAIRMIAGKGVVSAVKTTPPPTAPPTTRAAAPKTVAKVDGAAQFVRSKLIRAQTFFDGPSAWPSPFDALAVVPPTLEPTVPVPETPTTPPAEAPTTPPPGAPSESLPSVPLPTVPTETADPNQPPAVTRVPPLITGSTVIVKAAAGGVLSLGAKKYRGALELKGSSSGMSVVNELDVEQYLRGMGEVLSPTWPQASLESQAIVARTYALKMMAAKGSVCPTEKCQVYLGAQAEYPEMDAAVRASAGRVVTYEGELAATFYSASGGGTIADPSEVFGPGIQIPYLHAGTYPIDDPKAWRVEMSMVELGRRFGYPGTLYDATVAERGPSGRATLVALSGSKGVKTVIGTGFDKALNLRSTNFSIYTGRSGDPAPGATLPVVTGPLVSTPAFTVPDGGAGPSNASGDASGDADLSPGAGDAAVGYQSDLLPSSSARASVGSNETGSTADSPTTSTGAVTSGNSRAVTALPTTSPETTAAAGPTTTTFRAATTSATRSASTTVGLVAQAAAGRSPDSAPSPVPPWAGWAAMGGITLGALWLALRWALR